MWKKSCTLTRFAVFRIFWQRVVFLWGRKGWSADSHPDHNSRDIKCYFWWFLMSEKSCTLRQFALFRVFLQRVVFLWGRKGGSADSHLAYNSRDIKCYFLMIFNVEKSCTLTRFAVFRVLWQMVVFLWGRKGGSADSHPAHNSRDIKCYFLIIFNVRKKLYFKAISAILCIFTKGCFFMG